MVLFAGFTLLSFSGLFNWIESTFYNQRIRKSFETELAAKTESVLEYHYGNILRFSGLLKEDFVKRIYLPNQSKEDIFSQNNAFGKLKDEIPDLLIVRFLDGTGRKIHYSTFSDDIKKREEFSISYKNMDEADSSIPAEKLLVAEKGEPKVVLNGGRQEFIYCFPVQDAFDIYKGTALFYVSSRNLANHLLKMGFLGLGEGFTIIGSQGIAFGLGSKANPELTNKIFELWQKPGKKENIEPVGDDASGKRFFLFTRETEKFGFVALLASDSAFALHPIMKAILLAAFFVTSFLLVFLIFNVRQDAVLVLQDRIKRFQIQLVTEYLENKQEIDWERWQRELALRRNEVRQEIKRGIGKVKKAKAEEVDKLIDKSWDEILQVMGSKAQQKAPESMAQTDFSRLEDLLKKVISNAQLVIPVSQVQAAGVAEQKPRASIPVQPAAAAEQRTPGAVTETLESAEAVEAIEEVEAVEELGEVEAVEELGEAEAVEELEEAEAIEEEGVEPIGAQEAAVLAGSAREPEAVEELGEAEAVEELGEAEAVEELEEVEAIEEEGVEPIEAQEASVLVGSAREPEAVEELGEAEAVEELGEAEAVEELESIEAAGKPEPPTSAEETAPYAEELAEVESVEETEQAVEIEGSEDIEAALPWEEQPAALRFPSAAEKTIPDTFPEEEIVAAQDSESGEQAAALKEISPSDENSITAFLEEEHHVEHIEDEIEPIQPVEEIAEVLSLEEPGGIDVVEVLVPEDQQASSDDVEFIHPLEEVHEALSNEIAEELEEALLAEDAEIVESPEDAEEAETLEFLEELEAEWAEEAEIVQESEPIEEIPEPEAAEPEPYEYRQSERNEGKESETIADQAEPEEHLLHAFERPEEREEPEKSYGEETQESIEELEQLEEAKELQEVNQETTFMEESAAESIPDAEAVEEESIEELPVVEIPEVHELAAEEELSVAQEELEELSAPPDDSEDVLPVEEIDVRQDTYYYFRPRELEPVPRPEEREDDAAALLEENDLHEQQSEALLLSLQKAYESNQVPDYLMKTVEELWMADLVDVYGVAELKDAFTHETSEDEVVMFHDGVFQIRDEVYDREPAAKSNAELESLVNSLIGEEAKDISAGSIDDLISVKHVNIFEDQEMQDIQRTVRTVAIVKEKKNGTGVLTDEHGINFDAYLGKQKDDEAKIIKALIHVSGNLDGIFSIIFVDNGSAFIPEYTLGLSEKSRNICKISKREALYYMFLGKRQTVVVKWPLAQIRDMREKVIEADRRHVRGVVFVPLTFQRKSAYLCVGSKNLGTSVEHIAEAFSPGER